MDENKIRELERFSDSHPGVDVTPLLKDEFQPPLNRWRVYLVSVLLPPFGLYYTLKYLVIDADSNEKRHLGWWSLILTIVGLGIVLASFFVAASLLRSKTNLPQNPTDLLNEYRDLVQ